MLVTTITVVHVLLSLVGIAAGAVVLWGLLTTPRAAFWTDVFLWTTIATSVTGFFFPFHKLLPSHIIGILSLVVLLIAIRSRNRLPRTWAISTTLALYLNVFVLVAQLFMKVPALQALAPTQSEPPFAIAQGVVLIAFLFLGVRAMMRAH